MMSLTRALLLSSTLLAPSLNATASDGPPVGCWRAVLIVRSVQGGEQIEDRSGRCTLRFTQDLLSSTCETSAGPVTSTYQYRLVGPQGYRTTMVTSTFKTGLIGTTRDYQFRIDGDRLVTTTTLQSTTPPVRVETEAARMPCP